MNPRGFPLANFWVFREFKSHLKSEDHDVVDTHCFSFRLPKGKICSYCAATHQREILTELAGIVGLTDLREIGDSGVSIGSQNIPLSPYALRAFFHVGLLELLRAGDGLLFHGALFSHTLFAGASGVGKSTLMRRLAPYGKVYADDAVLLSFHNGELYGQGCPTWSSYFQTEQTPMRYNISCAVKIKQIMLLVRSREAGVVATSCPVENILGLMKCNSNIFMSEIMKLSASHINTQEYHFSQYDFITKVVDKLPVQKFSAPLDIPIASIAGRLY